MIKLTPNKAKLYELMKTGEYTAREMAEEMGINVRTIQKHLNHFMHAHIIKKTRDIQPRKYIAVEKEYAIVPDNYFTTGQMTTGNEYKVPQISLTSEQEFYLMHHMDEPRSKLCRKLGVTRLQLNFYLDRKLNKGA